VRHAVSGTSDWLWAEIGHRSALGSLPACLNRGPFLKEAP
jgi:hypothetical protein